MKLKIKKYFLRKIADLKRKDRLSQIEEICYTIAMLLLLLIVVTVIIPVILKQEWLGKIGVNLIPFMPLFLSIGWFCSGVMAIRDRRISYLSYGGVSEDRGIMAIVRGIFSVLLGGGMTLIFLYILIFVWWR